MQDQSTWFTVDQVDPDTYIVSEYRHWEETHCYLLNGRDRTLLIDTGLGICDISPVVAALARGPVTAVATHIHWDHIGGHRYYPDFYAHEAELPWLQGGFPQPIELIRGYVTDRCQFPEGYDVNTYEFFQGTPTRVLRGGETIHLGGHLRCHGSGLLHPVSGHRRAGHLRQLHWQGVHPARRGPAGGHPGHLCGLHRWPHHFPRLLRL